MGGTGSGKTHLATAIGVAAIHAGKRVRFYNAVDLVNLLERQKLVGKPGSLARKPIQADAVIVDESGDLPFPESGGALLFHLISQLYERTSIIIATNLAFGEWAGMEKSRKGDRLLPRTHYIQGMKRCSKILHK